MGELIQDVRLAIRSFRKTPVFTFGAILTLTLAIGVNTAIFSILNALMFRDLPVREPSSLVSLARVTSATQTARSPTRCSARSPNASKVCRR